MRKLESVTKVLLEMADEGIQGIRRKLAVSPEDEDLQMQYLRLLARQGQSFGEYEHDLAFRLFHKGSLKANADSFCHHFIQQGRVHAEALLPPFAKSITARGHWIEPRQTFYHDRLRISFSEWYFEFSDTSSELEKLDEAVLKTESWLNQHPKFAGNGTWVAFPVDAPTQRFYTVSGRYGQHMWLWFEFYQTMNPSLYNAIANFRG